MDQNHTEALLTISVPPHTRHAATVRSMMGCVVVALLPSLAVATAVFGPRALLVTITCVAAAVTTEYLLTLLMRRSATIGDLSALVCGMLLAFTLPPGIPLWMAALGAVFAVGVAKMAFGGLGHNFINPALAGRVFLMASYPAALAAFTGPRFGTSHGLSVETMADIASRVSERAGMAVDAITSATPLTAAREALQAGVFQAMDFQEALGPLFYGNVGGCIGATSALALIAGAAFLWYKGFVGFRVPVCFVGTVFLLFWASNGTGSYFSSEAIVVPTFQVLAGGLLLGALFMATDPVTSPITPLARVIYGVGCGLLTFVIRRFGAHPDGVCYAILMMNCVVPLLDRYTRPRYYGEGRPHA
jgi:electron transport complex protein RnfD